MYEIPEWLRLELASNHSGIVVRWQDYGPFKVFVMPITGDAFWRMPVRKLNSRVMYRRYLTRDSPKKWREHALTYFPDGDLVTTGRWVVFQENVITDEVVKLFDVVNDDGSLHPLDMRVVDAIRRRDGKFGAHEKAIADVEAAPERGEATVQAGYEEAVGDLFERIHYDVLHAASQNACVTLDPDEDDIQILTGEDAAAI